MLLRDTLSLTHKITKMMTNARPVILDTATGKVYEQTDIIPCSSGGVVAFAWVIPGPTDKLYTSTNMIEKEYYINQSMMNFQQALESLKYGMSVYRKGWLDYIPIKLSQPINGEQILMYVNCRPYTPTVTDMYAVDWIKV